MPWLGVPPEFDHGAPAQLPPEIVGEPHVGQMPPPPTAPPVATPEPAAPAATVPSDQVAVVTFALSGDILAHSPLWRGAARHAADAGRDGYDFGPMLAATATVHDTVDVAVCHLETPIAPAGEELSTMPYYGVPAEIADAIEAAGFDRCSTASNHTFDRGVAGIVRTVDELERVGVAQDGMARTPDEIAPRPFTVNGVSIAHLSYTYSYNGLRPPSGDEWRSRLIDPDRILADAAEARRLGADVVVVSLHWGSEGRTAPTDAQRALADVLTASGQIDLIIGHHAHVVQPIEQVNGVWVVYGLGNLLSNMPTGSFPPNSQDGAIVTLAVLRDGDGALTWLAPSVTPTWVDRHDGWRIVVLPQALADPALGPGRRSVLQASYDRTSAVFGELTVAVPGR